MVSMLKILDRLAQCSKTQPERIILVDNVKSVGVSYRQLDDISFKVLTYLKKKGIGREDFVVVCLPRGVAPAICIVGVLKAGAAFVLLEDNYTPERAAYIKKDCQCKLVIDYAVWQEIQHEEPSYTIAELDEHAAAFAVYTSGSTGNPKGVVHEYGNIAIICNPVPRDGHSFLQVSEDDIVPMITPWPFIPSISTLFLTLQHGFTLHILPYSIIKDISAFHNYMIDSRATKIFMSPTYFRLYKNISPYIKTIYLGSDHVQNIYRDDVKIINTYSSSECGFFVCAFEIDTMYGITPIGKPHVAFDVYVLDEDGQPVAEGEDGELCLYNPFVRGYLNRPEENRMSFRGGHVFHTGDIAHRLPDGNYVLVGRNSDMIKIHGNRIEPCEIEQAVKKVLHLDWVAAKGFAEKGSEFVCAYYVKDIQIDYGRTRTALQQLLPNYMVPSYFIKINEIPLGAHGKVDKKSLQPPEKDIFRAAYVAPSNDLEQRLCEAFSHALKMENIGIHDDFYLFGGDSLGAISVLSYCNIEGLSISDIFRARTPENIASICSQLSKNVTETEGHDHLHTAFSLLPEQMYLVDYQFYTPKSTMHNLFVFLRLGSGVDTARLAEAVRAAIHLHPALHTVFYFNEDGEIVQHYDPSLAEPIHVEKISESALTSLRDTLVQPFKLVHSHMYRCRIFETESSGYIFLDFHHAIFDGTSFTVLTFDIAAFYDDDNYSPCQDTYYTLLDENQRATTSKRYLEGKAYFERRYGDKPFSSLPKKDFETRKNYIGTVETLLPLSKQGLYEFSSKYSVSCNVFFIAITALALSVYNKYSAAELSWVYNGRDSINMMRVVGMILNIFPLCVQLPKERLLKEVLKDIKEQVSSAIEYNRYHYTALSSRCVIGDTVCMIYQDDLHDIESFCGEPFDKIPIRQNNAATQGLLDIEIVRRKDEISATFRFNSAVYKSQTMHALMEIFVRIVKRVIAGTALPELTVAMVVDE